jgi:hypothetical protein
MFPINEKASLAFLSSATFKLINSILTYLPLLSLQKQGNVQKQRFGRTLE